MNENVQVNQPFFGSTTDNINYTNLCVLGIPWDASSSFRRGAAQGPEYIRHATTGALYNSITETNRDLKQTWQIYDIGDAPISEANEMDARNKIHDMIQKYSRHGTKFFFLGGDHLSTYFTFYSLKKLKDIRIGLIYLDAHPDLYDQYEGNPYSHACVVKRIIDETNIEPETITQVGIRSSTLEQKQLAEQLKINTISIKDLQTNGGFATAQQIKSQLPDYLDGVYLSIDLDVLDPAFAPGVGNPEPGGATTREIIDFIHGLQGINIYAFDVVELCPKFDYAGISALAASKIIKEVLGIL
ncbi:MAG: agmatinase [Candidatus Heimdallarchaeota archaeon]